MQRKDIRERIIEANLQFSENAQRIVAENPGKFFVVCMLAGVYPIRMVDGGRLILDGQLTDPLVHNTRGEADRIAHIWNSPSTAAYDSWRDEIEVSVMTVDEFSAAMSARVESNKAFVAEMSDE